MYVAYFDVSYANSFANVTKDIIISKVQNRRHIVKNKKMKIHKLGQVGYHYTLF